MRGAPFYLYFFKTDHLFQFKMVFLFDIGRVLLDFDFEQSLKQLLPPETPNANERIKCILDRKDLLEAGLITSEEYTSWALDILQNNVTVPQFHHAWRSIFTLNKPMWQNVHELAETGHRLILISNINAIHYPWIITEFPQFSYFEEAILSFKIGLLKPQTEIYQYAISHYNLVPEKTIYIDDLPQNIAAGRQFRFQCWCYDIYNHPDFEQWLKKTLGINR
ncbi:MAG TPA: HAD family phosphatase [Nitrosomonas sp.]|nr:HAD family phosphatase [Nitrosomonas sp.]